MMREIVNLGLGAFALDNFLLQGFVGLNQLGHSLGDALFQGAVERLQRVVGLIEFVLCPFSLELGLDPRERRDEVDRLGDVVVGAGIEGFGDVRTVGLCRHHYDRELHRRMLRPYAFEHLDPVQTRHHDVEQNKIEMVSAN